MLRRVGLRSGALPRSKLPVRSRRASPRSARPQPFPGRGDLLLYQVIVGIGLRSAQDGTRVVLGLQQAGHQQRLIPAERGRLFLRIWPAVEPPGVDPVLEMLPEL